MDELLRRLDELTDDAITFANANDDNAAALILGGSLLSLRASMMNPVAMMRLAMVMRDFNDQELAKVKIDISRFYN